MLPTEVYTLACALDGVATGPSDEAITEAWRLYNALAASGWSLVRNQQAATAPP